MIKSQLRAQLARFGGSPVRRNPFRSRSDSWHIGAQERAAVGALFDQVAAAGVSPGYGGPEEVAYCREFAQLLGGGYADAVSSGTAALYVALQALELDAYSEVIVSAITDPGGMMPVPLLNLIPMVADTMPGSYNVGPRQIEAEITSRTSAIVVAHVGGEPAPVDAIAELARSKSIKLIEDCAQAHGSTLGGRPVGAFGDLAVFSTMHGKHIATGAQGGLVFTRDRSLYESVRRSSDRGKPFFASPGATNCRAALNLNLGEWACAIGRVQLARLPEFVEANASVVLGIARGIEGLTAVSVPPLVAGARANRWFLRLRVHADALECTKEEFCRALEAEGLPITARYDAALPHAMEWFVNRRVFGTSGLPWTSPAYGGDRDRRFPCPNARAALDAHFNLHCHEHWTGQDIQDAVAIMRKVGVAYGRGRQGAD